MGDEILSYIGLALCMYIWFNIIKLFFGGSKRNSSSNNYNNDPRNQNSNIGFNRFNLDENNKRK